MKRNEFFEKYIDSASEFEDGETGIYKCIDLLAEEVKKYYFTTRALEAGIPLSVIEGKTKLTDHFSQEYIDLQRNKK